MLEHVDNDHQIRVRYEDLESNPTQAVRRIVEWMDLDPSAAKSQPQDHALNVHHIPHEPLQSADGSTTIATQAEREAFERAAGPMNRRLGYFDG